MGVLEFLSARRFHQSYVLPPNIETGREYPHRFSYADFGDPRSNAVVFFCGALMGTRFCYSPLDQLANVYNVRIIHVDRPGIGGSDPIELEKRVQIWLVAQLRVTSFLPAPVIGKFASVVKFVNENVVPLVGLSSGLIHSQLRSNPYPAPVPLMQKTNRSRTPSSISHEDYQNLDLNNPYVVNELRKYSTQFLFADIFWSDIDYVVLLLSKIIETDTRLDGHNKTWIVDTFHAEQDDVVGEKGRQWFDNCWLPGRSSTCSARSNSSDIVQHYSHKTYEYRSEIVRGTDHNYLMDPASGASELWLQRVRDACPRPVKVLQEDEAPSVVTRSGTTGRRTSLRGFFGRVRTLAQPIYPWK
ncbi:hypothetical protein CC86DRAFT_398971 [Ophiobolus disseminans]|uniref:AB hydrolase-1 domain-containing protein n=1 Tax=Ophiobolus disseminans TaxID=1469910 RepID=A0A6A6ZEE6_9PLEO|nr:hypothetical protein CC86DRAFT_398971 [Ophiobolus disseminans]